MFKADMTESADTVKIAEQAFDEIARRFPHLYMVKDEGIPVAPSITLPVQPGLRQEVRLYLGDNDELNIIVGYFSGEWFPCTDPAKVEAYISAVCGYLSGAYRVLEHYRGKRCVKAELQEPITNGWGTIYTWTEVWPPIPWNKTFKEVRNV
jgi:hypothetical protein